MNAWVEINGVRMEVLALYVMPADAEIIAMTEDEEMVVWLDDHLEQARRIV